MHSTEPEIALRWADMAAELAGVGYWWMDAASQKIRWSPNMFKIFGVAPDLTPSLDYAMQFVHPDDRNAATSNLQNNLLGGTARSATRLVRPSGEIRYIEGRNACEYGPDGSVLAIYGTVHDVTDRHLADLALADSEARYRLLAEAASDVVLKVGPADVIEYVSPSIKRFGWRPEQMVGRTGASFLHPDDSERVLGNVSALKEDQPQPGTDRSYRMRKGDGDYVWIEANSTVVRAADGSVEALVCQLRDVSERRAATHALAESEERYRVIAENVTDVISRASPDGKLLYLSPSVTDVTGYSVEELTGVSMARLMHPDDRGEILASYVQVLAGAWPANTPLIYRARHKSGHWISIEASPTVVRDDTGEAIEILSVTRDVSARVKLEADLRAAAEAAEAAVTVKSNFLANMSHEIRTPLTAILGFSRLLNDRTDLDALAKSHLRRVSSAGEALLSIVNDVLDFSKLEAGQIELRPEAASAIDLLNDVISMFEIDASSRQVGLELRLRGAMPAGLLLDKTRVRQVLLNLIGNAVKFTERGQITVVAVYDAPANRLRVDVSDTGPGLSETQQARLFQRFSQVDASSTRRHGGTGLGLAICKGLVEAMGGVIGVASKQGQGATFSFDIIAPVAPLPVKVASRGQSSDLEGMRVLVADDNRNTRELVRAVLSSVDVEVTEVADGNEAVAEATATPFDAILMDVRMPGQDGPTALRHIRRHDGPNQYTPIIAFSADTKLEASVAKLFDGAVTKPLAPADLIACLADCLRDDTPGTSDATR